MFRNLRPYLIGLGLVVAAAGAFLGVVAPLFKTSGPPRAEVVGLVNTQLKFGQSGSLPVSIDNVGDSLIQPLCIKASFSTAVDVQYVVFDNNYKYPFSNGHACGGALVGQETINVTIMVTPHTAGPLQVTVVAVQGTTAISEPLHATVAVVNG